RARPAAEPQVRLRARHHGDARLPGELDVVRFETIHVQCREAGPEQTEVRESLDRAAAMLPEGVSYFDLGLMQRHRDARIELVRHAAQPREQRVARRERRWQRETQGNPGA